MRTSRGRRPGTIETLFPKCDGKMTWEERLRKIKRIVNKENFVTEEKLENAIERMINLVIFS